MKTILSKYIVIALLMGALAAPASAAPTIALNTATLVLSTLTIATPSLREMKETQDDTNQAIKDLKKADADLKDAVLRRESLAKKIQSLKEQGNNASALNTALKDALAVDEKVRNLQIRMQDAESRVLQHGNRLLFLYEKAIQAKQIEIQNYAKGSAAQRSAQETYQDLSTKYVQIQNILAPVLQSRQKKGGYSALTSEQLQINLNDDAETLLDKADLAADLGDRYLRQADEIQKKLVALEKSKAVAGDVARMMQQGSLFDEEDRRLFVTKTNTNSSFPSVSGGVDATIPQDGAPEANFGTSDPNTTPSDANTFVPPTDDQANDQRTPNPEVSTPRIGERVFAVNTDVNQLLLGQTNTQSAASLKAMQEKLRTEAARLRKKSQELRAAAAKKQ